jgi:hypothetical protein
MTGRKLKPLVFSVVALLACILVYGGVSCTGESRVTHLAKDEIRVIRTPGGMLEVSTLIRNEEFGWSSQHTCPLIDCGALFKPTVTEIRLPVHYTYRIPLAQSWTLRSKETYYELTVPREEPQVPAAPDFTKMEMRTSKGWLSPSAMNNRESLVRQLGPELARRATQQHYIDAQREDARKTVLEFASKWMKEQSVESNPKSLPIRVIFSGEVAAACSISRLCLPRFIGESTSVGAR